MEMKLKSVIGLILMILSIVGMYFWETKVREKMIFTKVLAAAVDISEGDTAGRDSFKEISVSSESLVAGFLTPENAETLYGKSCVFPLKANSVVFYGAFEDAKEEEDDGMRTLSIPRSWIFEGSADVSAGTGVSIYYVPSGKYAGNYDVSNAGETSVMIRCELESYFAMVSELEKNKDAKLLLVTD